MRNGWLNEKISRIAPLAEYSPKIFSLILQTNEWKSWKVKFMWLKSRPRVNVKIGENSYIYAIWNIIYQTLFQTVKIK